MVEVDIKGIIFAGFCAERMLLFWPVVMPNLPKPSTESNARSWNRNSLASVCVREGVCLITNVVFYLLFWTRVVLCVEYDSVFCDVYRWLRRGE